MLVWKAARSFTDRLDIAIKLMRKTGLIFDDD